MTEMAGGEEGEGIDGLGCEQGRERKEMGEAEERVRRELEMARRELEEAVAGMEQERAEWGEKERVSVKARAEERAGWEGERKDGERRMRELQDTVARLGVEVEVERKRAGVAVEKAKEEGKQEEREKAAEALEAGGRAAEVCGFGFRDRV